MEIEMHKMKGHDEGIHTAKEYLKHRTADDIDALIMGLQFADGRRQAIATSRLENEDSAEIFDMLADQVVYLAEKHDSHPAGVLQHLIHVVQERDDTPEVDR